MKVGKYYYYNYERETEGTPWECVHIGTDGWATLIRMSKDYRGDPHKTSTTTLVSDSEMYEFMGNRLVVDVFLNDNGQLFLMPSSRGAERSSSYMGTIKIITKDDEIVSVTY